MRIKSIYIQFRMTSLNKKGGFRPSLFVTARAARGGIILPPTSGGTASTLQYVQGGFKMGHAMSP